MSKINLNTIERITVIGRTESNKWVYVPAKTKWFGLVFVEDHLIDYWKDKMPIEKMDKNNLVLAFKKVYRKPRVILEFCSGKFEVKYFDTKKEAQKFADIIESGVNSLMLEV